MRKPEKAFVATGEAAGASSSPRAGSRAAQRSAAARTRSAASTRAGRDKARSPEFPLRIGEVARRAGVGIDALRFYEREGLIPTTPRDSSSGYRVYSVDVVRTVRFIREAQALGFTLKETAELLRLSNDKTTACSDVRRAAEAKLADIERRIQRLRSVRSALRSLVVTCSDGGSDRECPILEALLDGADSQPEPKPRAARGPRAASPRGRG